MPVNRMDTGAQKKDAQQASALPEEAPSAKTLERHPSRYEVKQDFAMERGEVEADSES